MASRVTPTTILSADLPTWQLLREPRSSKNLGAARHRWSGPRHNGGPRHYYAGELGQLAAWEQRDANCRPN
jgi:hypothetical protein